MTTHLFGGAAATAEATRARLATAVTVNEVLSMGVRLRWTGVNVVRVRVYLDWANV